MEFILIYLLLGISMAIMWHIRYIRVAILSTYEFALKNKYRAKDNHVYTDRWAIYLISYIGITLMFPFFFLATVLAERTEVITILSKNLFETWYKQN